MGNGANAEPTRRIAVYWDFENIHQGIQPMDRVGGLRHGARGLGEEMVNVKAVMDYLNALGDVVINRAYANWTMLKNYRFILLEYSVDLVQLFPRGQHAKNGADIRLSLDALEDVFNFDEVDTHVVIGGDSDFAGLGQKLRQYGKYVVGIGARNSSNIYWIKACNEFKYYDTLVTRLEEEEEGDGDGGDRRRVSPSLDAAKELLLRAVRRLIRSRDDGLAPLARVRPMMLRMDPSFDEGAFEHDTFREFVEACSDVARIEEDEAEGKVVVPVRLDKPAAPRADETYSDEELLTVYRNTLRQIHYRLITPDERNQALKALYDLLVEEGPLEDQAQVKSRLVEIYAEDGMSLTDEEAQNIWDLGYKANAYYFQEYPYRQIVINERVTNLEAMFRRADVSVIKRLLGRCPVQPLRSSVVAELLYGPDADRDEAVDELIREMTTGA
ncbi:MAG: NYN domain-containing protein [Deltaproteobacteria bacterium]|nr:NYN domain-containing protein [Deltaproteobacteria bacterium]